MEERLTRVKHQKGFPKKSINMLFNMLGVGPEDFDVVTYPFYSWYRERDLLWKAYKKNILENWREDDSLKSKAFHAANYYKWTCKAISDHRSFHMELEKKLRSMGLWNKLVRVEHQLAHAASAFYPSGFENALIVTLDWYGSGLAGSVSLGSRTGGIKRLCNIEYPHSMGVFYAQVTSALGFRVSHHEGKIVGLAAYGDPDKCFDAVYKRFIERDDYYFFVSAMNDRYAKEMAKVESREDMSAAYQCVLEKVVTGFIAKWIKKTGVNAVALAGGVAANVKLNQRILAIPGVDRIFVHPAMGDDGTGTGSALYVASQKGYAGKRMDSATLGPAYSEEKIKHALDKAGLSYKHFDDIEVEIAKRLADNKVVARFDGRMEYGPRALGNRTIMYPAVDPTVNDWLNKRLDRSEFMPFAPATLSEDMDKCYMGLAGAEHAAKFMTVTTDCTEYMKKNSSAAVHVDGTARPQLVDEKTYPSFYKILKEYKKLTGLSTLINTSFNIHEHPIVCTPHDAIRAFTYGHLDYLAIGKFLTFQNKE